MMDRENVSMEVNVAQGNEKGLKMKDLMVATGLPKSTLLHYVAQGLLPQPLKTGRNMAYYDPACVERAKLIKRVQGTYSFPLEKIKRLLDGMDNGEDVTPFIELDTAVFGAMSGPELDRASFQEATGLTFGQVEELLSAGLLLPLKEGVFTQEDVEAGRAFAGGFERGLRADDLLFYVKVARELVDYQMRLRQRLTGHLPDGEDARTTAELTRGARLLRNYIMDRVFQRRVAAATTLKDERLLS
jgi:DNA-binding transcriptional MerR regulator